MDRLGELRREKSGEVVGELGGLDFAEEWDDSRGFETLDLVDEILGQEIVIEAGFHLRMRLAYPASHGKCRIAECRTSLGFCSFALTRCSRSQMRSAAAVATSSLMPQDFWNVSSAAAARDARSPFVQLGFSKPSVVS